MLRTRCCKQIHLRYYARNKLHYSKRMRLEWNKSFTCQFDVAVESGKIK